MELQFSLDDIDAAAEKVWAAVGGARVIAFHGEMGAGKTTLIHAMCDSKGVQDAVGSPTFSIINEYSYVLNGQGRKIFHLDLYRLKGEQEAIDAGVEDSLYSDQVCLVEWPERAAGIFPPDTKHVFIDIVDSVHRKLRIGDK
jgi:tRNA threonylcarbamoyladenosine biosynthesis protein TsaE